MSRPLLQLQGTISKLMTLADNTIRLTVDTQDIAPDDAHALFEQRGALGFFLFSPFKMKAEDIPDEPAKEFRSDKTPSQRLRAVLYCVWEATGKTKTFDEFYTSSVEAICEQYKDKYLR